MKLTPNRVAVYLTALASLAAGLAPVVADLDLQSTAGVVAGLTAIVVVVNRWLVGWQHHEDRTHWAAREDRDADKTPVGF